MKNCKDCKYFDRDGIKSDYYPEFWKCAKNLQIKEEYSSVGVKKIYKLNEYCESNRENENKCGPDAVWFKKRRFHLIKKLLEI